jgi:hypothetical protein
MRRPRRYGNLAEFARLKARWSVFCLAMLVSVGFDFTEDVAVHGAGFPGIGKAG